MTHFACILGVSPSLAAFFWSCYCGKYPTPKRTRPSRSIPPPENHQIMADYRPAIGNRGPGFECYQRAFQNPDPNPRRPFFVLFVPTRAPSARTGASRILTGKQEAPKNTSGHASPPQINLPSDPRDPCFPEEHPRELPKPSLNLGWRRSIPPFSSSGWADRRRLFDQSPFLYLRPKPPEYRR